MDAYDENGKTFDEIPSYVCQKDVMITRMKRITSVDL